MKEIILLVLGFSLALGVSAQRNTFYFGDKDAGEIESSIAAFDELIVDYEASVESLKKENDQMISDFQKLGGHQFANTYAKKTVENDSLINLYRSKIFELQETKQGFLEMTAGKSKKRMVKSKGNNPYKLAAAAEAYATMSYTDAYLAGANFSPDGQMPDSGLKGLIINKYYQDLTVTVIGPGNWQRLYSVSRNGGKIFFNPPYPGRYIFSFSNGRDVSSQVGYCRPGLSGACDEQGNKYDLMAIMPRGH